MPVMKTFSLTINGALHVVDTDPATPLLFVLRNQLGLMGAKLGCGLEQCGACAVLVDGRSTLSCTAAAGDFEGRDIVTVEGLAADDNLHAVQQAFVDAGAAQCGYCTPGMVIAVAGLLAANPKPSDRDINDALTPHLCRCGSHARILEAVGSLISD